MAKSKKILEQKLQYLYSEPPKVIKWEDGQKVLVDREDIGKYYDALLTLETDGRYRMWVTWGRIYPQANKFNGTADKYLGDSEAEARTIFYKTVAEKIAEGDYEIVD
jgi:hypothetical protein